VTWAICLLVAGACFSTLVGGLDALAESVLAAGLLALPYLILVACGRGGSSEARLMAAIGAWLGIIQGAVVLLAAGLAGFLLGLTASIGGRRLSLALPGGARAILGSPRVEGRLPQGPAILAGVVVASVWSVAWL
jgi:prepilin signal peptidase PulO-like enzyme (type II secretory pathway)